MTSQSQKCKHNPKLEPFVLPVTLVMGGLLAFDSQQFCLRETCSVSSTSFLAIFVLMGLGLLLRLIHYNTALGSSTAMNNHSRIYSLSCLDLTNDIEI